MGLFGNKMTFGEAVDILSNKNLSEKDRKRVIKASDKFTKDEDKACVVLLWLHKNDCKMALNGVGLLTGKPMSDEMMKALNLPYTFNSIYKAYLDEPTNSSFIIYVANAFENGIGTERNHEKAVEVIESICNISKDNSYYERAKSLYCEIMGHEPELSEQAPSKSENNAESNPAKSNDSAVIRQRLEFADGEYYDGETVNGLPDGFGIYKYKDGSSYEGEWKSGYENGQGKYTYNNGSVYEGEWKNGKEDGFGKCIYSDGDSYEGEWRNGDENGSGVMVYDGIGTYDGEWVDGAENGFGIMEYADGERYEGEWKDGNENGEGKMTYANKDEYDGEWLDGDEHGEGTLIGADGKIFQVIYEHGELISKTPVKKQKIDLSEFSEWGSAKSAEYAAKQREKSEKREKMKNSINDAVYLMMNPECFTDVNDRNIEESCYYFGNQLTEAEKLFLDDKNEESAEIICEILGVKYDPDLDWINDPETEYFCDYVFDAMRWAKDEYDVITDRMIVAAANVATYIWKKQNVTSLFGAVKNMWIESGKDYDSDYLWFARMYENGDSKKSCSDDITERNYGWNVDVYTMGSNCKLYNPLDPDQEIHDFGAYY